MLALIFAVTLAVNFIVAMASGRKGLIKMALLFIGSYLASEIVSAWIHVPARIAIYAILDSVGMMLALITVFGHQSTRPLRWVMTITYGSMLIAHALILSKVHVSAYAYYMALNVMFMAQVISCGGTGVRLLSVARQHGDLPSVSGLRRVRHREDHPA